MLLARVRLWNACADLGPWGTTVAAVQGACAQTTKQEPSCQKLREQTASQGTLSEGSKAHVPVQGEGVLFGSRSVSLLTKERRPTELILQLERCSDDGNTTEPLLSFTNLKKSLAFIELPSNR